MELKMAMASALLERARGMDVERFSADLPATDLDPEDRVKLYLELADNTSERPGTCIPTETCYRGEKCWGAVASPLNAIAEKRGWEHRRHRDHKATLGRLYGETGNEALMIGMRMAEGLHTNFYHAHMDREEFDIHRRWVLVERLRRLFR